MDFTKFVSLLDSSTLFVPRADQFEDAFEGSFPSHMIESRFQLLGKAIYHPPKTTAAERRAYVLRFRSSYEKIRRHTYISCWHESEYESEAMWKIYSSMSDSVAITTTFGKLSYLFDDSYSLRRVRYLDFYRVRLPEITHGANFFYKRREFEHESEVRAITCTWDGDSFEDLEKETPLGIPVPVDVTALIDGVYVSPTSSPWFARLVASVSGKYGLGRDITASTLAGRASF